MKNYEKVTFLYINNYKLNGSIHVNHYVGSTEVDKDYLEKVFQSDDPDMYQVLSFDVGTVLIFNTKGDTYSIVPTSGIVDVYYFMMYFFGGKNFRHMSGYNVEEFYRCYNEADEDYTVNFRENEDRIFLYYKDFSASFHKREFVDGITKFAYDIILFYDNKYPSFSHSPLRQKIVDLIKHS